MRIEGRGRAKVGRNEVGRYRFALMAETLRSGQKTWTKSFKDTLFGRFGLGSASARARPPEG